MSIILLFSRSKRIGSRLIRLATWSEYSHVDAVLRDKSLIGALYGKGVVRYDLSSRLENSTEYCFRAVGGDPNLFEEYLKSQLGKPYDLEAVFGIMFRRDWAEDSKWFCSELVAAALVAAGVEAVQKKFGRITPQDLLESPLIRPYRIGP